MCVCACFTSGHPELVVLGFEPGSFGLPSGVQLIQVFPVCCVVACFESNKIPLFWGCFACESFFQKVSTPDGHVPSEWHSVWECLSANQSCQFGYIPEKTRPNLGGSLRAGFPEPTHHPSRSPNLQVTTRPVDQTPSPQQFVSGFALFLRGSRGSLAFVWGLLAGHLVCLGPGCFGATWRRWGRA